MLNNNEKNIFDIEIDNDDILFKDEDFELVGNNNEQELTEIFNDKELKEREIEMANKEAELKAKAEAKKKDAEAKEKVVSIITKRVSDLISNIYSRNNPEGISAEMCIFEIIKMKNIISLDEDGEIYIYDEQEMFFKKSYDEDVEVAISRVMSQYSALSKYAKASFYTSASSTLCINLRASSSYTKFKKNSFAIDVVDRTGLKHTLNMRMVNHEKKGFIYIAEKALPSHKVNFKIYSELNIDNFVDHDGFNFELGCTYYYKPKCDRSSPFFKYLMNGMFTDKCFEDIEQEYYGSVINGFEMQTSLLRLGTGRNGKGLRTRMDKLIFNGRKHYQIAIVDFNSSDRSSFFAINKMRWLISNEMKKDNFQEQFLKMIIGKDSLAVRALYKNMNLDGVKPDDNAGVILNANYSDLFVLSDQGTSMQERITPIETASAIEIVEGLFQVITEGGIITSEKFCKYYNKGEVINVSEEEAEQSFSEYVDWMLEGGIKFKSKNKRMASENYGKVAVDFKKIVLDKMSGSAETFEELELIKTDEGYGCSVKELYEIFLKAMNRDRRNYSLIKFSKELSINYKKAFGEELPFSDKEKRAFCNVYDARGVIVLEADGKPMKTYSKIVGVAFNNIKSELLRPCGKSSYSNKVLRSEESKQEKEIVDQFNEAENGKKKDDQMKDQFKLF